MTLKISYTRTDSGWWHAVLTDPRLPDPIEMRGQSIQHARNKIKAQLKSLIRTKKAAKIDDTTLEDRIVLPRTTEKAVRAYKSARERMERVRTEIKQEQSVVAEALLTLRLSTRDCAEILGISRQRAQQLLDVQRRLRKTDSSSA